MRILSTCLALMYLCSAPASHSTTRLLRHIYTVNPCLTFTYSVPASYSHNQCLPCTHLPVHSHTDSLPQIRIISHCLTFMYSVPASDSYTQFLSYTTKSVPHIYCIQSLPHSHTKTHTHILRCRRTLTYSLPAKRPNTQSLPHIHIHTSCPTFTYSDPASHVRCTQFLPLTRSIFHMPHMPVDASILGSPHGCRITTSTHTWEEQVGGPAAPGSRVRAKALEKGVLVLSRGTWEVVGSGPGPGHDIRSRAGPSGPMGMGSFKKGRKASHAP